MNAFAALLQTFAPDPAFCTRLTIALAHLVWQGLAIAALGLMAGRLLRRRSANLRYALHVAALVLLALCLPATFCFVEAPQSADDAIGRQSAAAPALAQTGMASFEAIHVTDEAATDGDVLPTGKQNGPRVESPALAAAPVRPEAGTEGAAPQLHRRWRRLMESAAPYATGFYFLGVLVMSLRLMLGLWGGHRLRRSATPVTDQALLDAVRRQAKQLGLRFVPVVAWCQRVSTPIVVGIVTPAVLLPASLAGGLTPDQLSALLVHELAHIRRFDLVVNLLQRIVETLLFFHPAVWYLSRQISRERENCCDDCVLAAGWRGTDYAGALLRMAELCLAGRADATSLAVLSAAGERPSEFKRRVLRLLGIETPSPLRLSRPGVAVLSSFLTLALASPALTHPLGNREVKQQLPKQTGVGLPQEEAPVEGRGREGLLAQAGGGEKAGRAGLRVYGRVLDASTGKPVEESRVIPTSVFDEKTHQYTWQPQYRKTFKDGVYEWKTDRPWDMTRLRIEAPGYRPAVSRAIQRGQGAVKIDVRLTPDEGITGVVLTPEGKPAADAQLALATWTFEVTVQDGELRQRGHAADLGVKVVYADEEGRFRLPPEIDPAVIVVAHDSGYAEVDAPGAQPLPEAKVDGDDDAAGAAKSHDLEIKLQRWGRVEGWVRAGDMPVEGAKFWVGSGFIKRSDLVNIHAGDDATSDADGRFAVERVPPGRGWCQRHVPDAKGTGSVGISGLDVQFDIPAGASVPLEIGGKGRTVVGKVRPPEGFAKKINWSKVTLNVFPRAPHIGFGGDNALWAAWSAFLKTEEGRPYNREGVAIAADGSFRIEGLPAADFQVVISVPGAAVAEEPQPKGTAAHGGGSFKISAVSADGDDKPFDAGVFQLVTAATVGKNPVPPPEPAKSDETTNAAGSDREWSIDRNGLRIRLTLLTGKPAVGQPLKVRLEIRNTADADRRYRFQKAYAHTGFRIKLPNGKPAEDIVGPAQIQEPRPQTIQPGETVTLIDEIDLAAAFLLPESGTYEISYPGSIEPERASGDENRPAGVPPSNRLSARLAGGTLSDFQATLLGIRTIAPKDWTVVAYQPSIIAFPPNFRKGPSGRLVQLKFSKDELPADASPRENQPPFRRLGMTRLGHAYLSAPEELKAGWPGCIEEIHKQLPRDDQKNEKAAADSFEVKLKLDRAEFLLGESIAVEYEMTNPGQQPVPYGRGGYYPDLRWNDGFRISAVKIDEQGKPIGKPVANWPAPESHGGPVGAWQLKPGERYAETLFVTRVVRFAEPGRYRIRVENTGRENEKAYSAAETIVTLKAPTAELAREVFQAMKRAPRNAYNDNAMKFLADAADFETMHQPVYLPILREFAMKGDVDALPSLERMETLEGNEVLVAALARALDGDDFEVARACYRHLQASLPFPNWYDEGNGDYDKPRRDRSDRTWKAEFVPTLTRLAHRLIPEVAFQIRTMGDSPELLQKTAQPLLGEIDYIYRCVGRPEDFADCMKAYAQSIELTKTLPLEKHQYFRPRGSAFGFGHTVFRMMQRGAPAPTKPAHPGEAAMFAMALRTQKDFRPAEWEAEVMKWLKAGPPYLAEVILDHLPEPISDEVLDWIPQALASEYIDLAIAGCKIAEKHPRAAYKAPLQKLLETATEQYLVKFSRTAAKANGLDVGKVNDDE